MYPNYATAYAAWKAKAQQTVDNAHMRYFIVHLHRLLDPADRPAPDTSGHRQWRSEASRTPTMGSKGGWADGGAISAARLQNQQYPFEPAKIHELIDSELPAIIAMWHGQHVLIAVHQGRRAIAPRC